VARTPERVRDRKGAHGEKRKRKNQRIVKKVVLCPPRRKFQASAAVVPLNYTSWGSPPRNLPSGEQTKSLSNPIAGWSKACQIGKRGARKTTTSGKGSGESSLIPGKALQKSYPSGWTFHRSVRPSLERGRQPDGGGNSTKYKKHSLGGCIQNL